MITVLEGNEGFDRAIQPTDWRYSAVIVGLYRYFEYLSKQDEKRRYQIDKKKNTFYYNSSEVEIEDEKNYYLFAEECFREDMHHTKIESILDGVKEPSEEQIKLINEKLSANAVMKSVFKGYRYNNQNRDDILKKIDENRLEIVKKTFQMMKKGYANFANPNLLRTKSADVCRLAGFHVDMGRKTRGISYNFDFLTFCGKDEQEFDFIPFAFPKIKKSVFINNNFSIKDLIHSNESLQEELNQAIREEKRDVINFQKILFFSSKKGSAYINYDVEVVVKDRERSHYETMIVRGEAIKMFQIIEKMESKKIQEEKNVIKSLSYPCRLATGDYLDVMEITVDHVLNRIYLDDLIERLLKDKAKDDGVYRHGFLLHQLIRINYVLYKEDDYFVRDDIAMLKARSAAQEVVQSLIKHQAENKIKSYRQKLISCLIFKNYSRFIEIMLQLSSYSQVSMSFLYDLAQDFEKNKNVAYVFVNGLEKYNSEQGEKKDEK